jgi:hypothetical protein
MVDGPLRDQLHMRIFSLKAGCRRLRMFETTVQTKSQEWQGGASATVGYPPAPHTAGKDRDAAVFMEK